MDKPTLRQLGRIQSREIKDRAGQEYDDLIAQLLFDTQYFMPRTNIALYVALKGEVSCAAIADRLKRQGHNLCLPVITGAAQPMMFRAWRPGDETRQGIFGQREPFDDQDEVMPDVVIVPMLGFTRTGHRLGYGSGFYDRTLAALRIIKPVRAIGLAYADQEIADLPVEPHDEKMDIILTERGAVTPMEQA